MLPRKLIFLVTKTHLMIKRDLLQQIIYFVVKLGPLIQTFFVAENNFQTLCYREIDFFVTKTHLMVKRDLLQQIIYFVVLIQTFL